MVGKRDDEIGYSDITIGHFVTSSGGTVNIAAGALAIDGGYAPAAAGNPVITIGAPLVVGGIAMSYSPRVIEGAALLVTSMYGLVSLLPIWCPYAPALSSTSVFDVQSAIRKTLLRPWTTYSLGCWPICGLKIIQSCRDRDALSRLYQRRRPPHEVACVFENIGLGVFQIK
ncbi:hypothetical protein [Oleiagrimonas soli]|uniref:Uncharacterized protein n=1 Tax=Oleiagrimonas soli TaxID=1543381 RepID=A0A841KIS5_9GAMM|nr:hypothetical protein [Oleiagrimonas soli]MBB6184965.1 hypothetical protein [Oleiagrimonas soli]